MAFTFNIIYTGSIQQGPWALTETSSVDLITVKGPVQAILVPDEPTEKSTLDSYTLTLLENGQPGTLPPVKDPDYQFYVDHQNTDGVVDDSFFADGPHGRLFVFTGNQLTAQYSVLQASGGKVTRAHLTLADIEADITADIAAVSRK